MITYELAKQLKEAGFPQVGNLHEGSYLHISGEPDRLAVVEPTLSELIEACGSNFDELTRDKRNTGGDWLATYWIQDLTYQGQGETPEEAVARLWLSLNPSPKE